MEKSKVSSAFIIHPDSFWKKIWDGVIGLNILICAFIIPLSLTLHLDEHPKTSAWLWAFNLWTSIIFFADMFVMFRTAYYTEEDGELVTDPKKIAMHYFKGWFTIDLLSALPFFLFFGSDTSSGAMKVFRFFKLFRLLRLVKLWSRISWHLSHSSGSSYSQILFVVFWLPIIVHSLICGWLVINKVVWDDQIFLNYVRAFYWCITTIATVGYGDITPDRNDAFAMIYASGVMIIGAGFYGYIIGNISNLLAKRDVAKVHYFEKMDRINAFLKYHNIPSTLQDRIRNYHQFIWNTRRGYDEETVLAELPIGMKLEVAMHMKREFLDKVEIFRGCGSNLIRELVLSMHSAVFLPGETICHHGEIGEEMYFISRGRVDVLSQDEKTTYATLGEGNFFGEIALIKRTPRTATIKAVECCDLYALNKMNFDQILQRHPEFAEHIQKITAKRSS